MKLNEISNKRYVGNSILMQSEIDNAFDNYKSTTPENFHTTFIEYFNDYFTDEQVDSGEMDTVINNQWDIFQSRRG